MVLIINVKRRQQCVSHELGRSARELDELARSHEGPVLVSRVAGLAKEWSFEGQMLAGLAIGRSWANLK
jgi:hypothetical protein